MYKFALLLSFLFISFNSSAQKHHRGKYHSIGTNDTCYELNYQYQLTDSLETIKINIEIDSIRLGRDLYVVNMDTSISLSSTPKTIHIQGDIYIRFRKAIIVDEGVAANHIRYTVYRKTPKCWEDVNSSSYEPFGPNAELNETTISSGDRIEYFEGYYWSISRR